MFRPNNFAEFIGHSDAISILKNSIEICKLQNKQLEHVLIYGPPGTGKTSLASIISNELNTNIKYVQGGNLIKNCDIINILLSLNEKEILFIDELHSISPTCMEILYIAMEDKSIDLIIGKDFNKKITRIKLPDFTLVGATTNLGRISTPFEDRFGIVINLKEYKVEWIKTIIINYCKKNNIDLKKEEISTIANNSKNIPRNALRITNRIVELKYNDQWISINNCLKKLNIYKDGLEENDVMFLKMLNESKTPLGIKTISQILNIEKETIENKIELYLLRNKYICKTNKGRVITDKGKTYLENLNFDN